MSRRERILEVFHKFGGMTAESFLMNFGLFGLEKTYDLKSELQTLVNYQKLRKIGNVYFPVGQPEKMAVVMDIVPAKYQPEFKPLKTFLPKVSPRGQQIAERSFKTCVSNVKDTFFRNEGLSKV